MINAPGAEAKRDKRKLRDDGDSGVDTDDEVIDIVDMDQGAHESIPAAVGGGNRRPGKGTRTT